MIDAAVRYTSRELPPEEWPRLETLGLAQNLPDPSAAAICVVERDGAIVATWVAMTTIHLEGCAIAPRCQKSPGVVKALVEGMNALLAARNIPQVLTVTQTEAVAVLAAKLGGEPVGTLWVLPVPLHEGKV